MGSLFNNLVYGPVPYRNRPSKEHGRCVFLLPRIAKQKPWSMVFGPSSLPAIGGQPSAVGGQKNTEDASFHCHGLQSKNQGLWSIVHRLYQQSAVSRRPSAVKGTRKMHLSIATDCKAKTMVYGPSSIVFTSNRRSAVSRRRSAVKKTTLIKTPKNYEIPLPDHR
ncbi:hypothetical protein LZD49_05190 [Dyadobacter sp. CY261]|uniref:hypothetical protein n=1 Tax=Dyadobacter sp. CY261 TaxID=2907203 RepID=UPI001F3EC2CB|nr:hypothetical protein [Dyadobacter sp. CY261]MCF0069856.1 hypothetical protein [Dyadobacter sp. CY261]